MTSSQRGHWLKEVAQHAGLKLELPDQPDRQEFTAAWPQVVEACRMPDEAFTQRLAGYFRTAVADLSSYDPQAVKMIPEDVARRHGVLALSATADTVVVATSDPANTAAQRDIQACAGRQPVFMIASPAQLAPVMERAYAPARAPRNTLQTLIADVASSDFQVVTNVGAGLFQTGFELEDPPLVKLTDFLLQQALRFRATEVHLEPSAQKGRVRYRVDGVLQHFVDLPSIAHQRVVARLKHVTRTQPGLKPEDGFPVRAGTVEKLAFLWTSPSPDGELVWIQLRDSHDVPTLERLGFDGEEGAKIRRVLAKPDGLVLVTGPARSGTSSFVYAALNELSGHSVLSLEGRPDTLVPGVTQIRYDAASGRSFAESLQQLLERNPDVLHAGEVRDLATARIVLRTAVTGRKVLATLHTPDTISGIRRLVDLGLASGRLAESLHAVISLRLVRRLCEKCARPFEPERDAKSREATLAELMRVPPVRMSVGCKVCVGTGFYEQIPLPEILEVTPEVKQLLAAGAGDAEILRAARAAGMRTFTELALDRVSRGQTTMEEIDRVVGCVPLRDQSPDAMGGVLLVEDDPGDRALVGAMLRQMGFPVVEADGVARAEEALRSGEHFSLAIIDLYLPALEGPDLVRTIRRSLATQALPVIVLTGSENPRHEFEILDAGADDYLLKPIDPERLQSRVRAVLRRSGIEVAG